MPAAVQKRETRNGGGVSVVGQENLAVAGRRFRVAVRVAGIAYWVDLADYGGWRVPEVVNPVEPATETRTTAVLSTISIPISDFGPEVAGAGALEAVEFDLASTYSAGRFYLSAVVVTGWKGETLA